MSNHISTTTTTTDHDHPPNNNPNNDNNITTPPQLLHVLQRVINRIPQHISNQNWNSVRHDIRLLQQITTPRTTTQVQTTTYKEWIETIDGRAWEYIVAYDLYGTSTIVCGATNVF